MKNILQALFLFLLMYAGFANAAQGIDSIEDNKTILGRLDKDWVNGCLNGAMKYSETILKFDSPEKEMDYAECACVAVDKETISVTKNKNKAARIMFGCMAGVEVVAFGVGVRNNLTPQEVMDVKHNAQTKFCVKQ
jgi:hypothetical protein